MNQIKRFINYFSKTEIVIWISSIVLIVGSFVLFEDDGYLTMIASIIGATAILFNAKGNPVGMALMIVFSLFYGYISWSFSYYGEMITYLGMSAPMSVLALVSWLRNPYNGRRTEVKINRIKRWEVWLMLSLTVVVTVLFYFILKVFGTANLIPSTLSVSTSFLAVCLTFRRSPYFAFVYALNDVVLLILWSLASLTDPSYLSVVICFVAFLINDLYSFFNWIRMEKRQKGTQKAPIS